MGAEQTIYANKITDVAQTILTSSPPQNPQEVMNHSKNLLNAFGGGKKETEARRSLGRLVNMDGLKEVTYLRIKDEFGDLEHLSKQEQFWFDKSYGEDFDKNFFSKLDDLVPLRGNRAFLISQLILHPDNFPQEYSELLNKDDTLARGLLGKALASDSEHYETDIKSEWKIRQAKIKSNEELIKKINEKISTPDSGGLS